MAANRLTASLRSGDPVIGAFCGIPSAVSAEFVAAAGFDYVCVDMQHGLVDFADLPGMLGAIGGQGCVPLVRVPAAEPWIIMKALDAGALGIVVPLVNTPRDAERAVFACRYPPQGGRSFGPVRASVVVGSREPSELADVACVAMIETAEGLANASDIARTPGVDALYVGPVDLSLGLGLAPGYERPEPSHGDAIRRIRAAAAAAGVAAGIQCLDGAAAKRWRDEGFQMTTVGNDHAWLRAAAAHELAASKGD